jgi:hypothetical protein
MRNLNGLHMQKKSVLHIMRPRIMMGNHDEYEKATSGKGTTTSIPTGVAAPKVALIL